MAGQKISFDMKKGEFRDYEELYRLHAEGKLSGTDIGLPCSQNRLIVIDVDVPSKSHAFDGRQWIKDHWEIYPELQKTYRVETPSGGCHFYLFLPKHIDPILFSPRASLAKGVDVKWNGYVVAPPTPGYEPKGRLQEIQEISLSLIEHLGYTETRVDKPINDFKVNVPLPKEGAYKLLNRLKEVMPKHTLSYSEWVEGIFSICAAVDDEELREECIFALTNNKSFKEGDYEQALAKAKTVDPHGGIGPGTIIKMLDTRSPIEKDKSKELQTAITTNAILNDPELFWKYAKDGNSILVPTENNAFVILKGMYPNGYHGHIEGKHPSLFVDRRKRELIINGEVCTSEIDTLISSLLAEMQSKHKLIQFRSHILRHGLNVLLQNREVDPMLEKTKRITWDRKERIDSFFIDYCKCVGSDMAYLRGVGRTFWRSLVYRILSPGYKCDEIVILQGPEGVGKSTMVSMIAKGHFYACSDKKAFSDRDCLINMHKSAIVELVEMIPLLYNDADQAKGYITQTHDFVRQMFGRQSSDSPRSFMLIGTCNKRHILTKTHGYRRFLPVTINDKDAINLMAIEEDLDQMYAEAYEDYKLRKRNFGLVKTDDRASQVEAFTVAHPWGNLLKPIIKDKTILTDNELYDHLRVGSALGSGEMGIETNRKLYGVMEHLGYERIEDKWVKN